MYAFEPYALFVVHTDASEKVVLRLGESSFGDMENRAVDAEESTEESTAFMLAIVWLWAVMFDSFL